MGRNRGGDIYHLALSYLTLPRTCNQNGHALAGVVAAVPCGIIAMIGGDKEQIIGLERGQERAKLFVKPFKMARIAGCVAAVTVVCIKFDKIGECERAFGGR